MATFESLNLNNEIMKALTDLKFLDATEIQEKAIPPMIEKKDIIGIAQTGTGKTFAYSIPLVTNVTNEKYTQALVLCPTRELGLQVSAEIKKLVKYSKNINIATIYGGTSYDRQIRELKARPQIVIGTPGRIIDHMKRHTIDFSKLNTLVLDEADEMLNMGFQDDLETILATTPKERQTALFSATMPDFIKHVAVKYLTDPIKIEIKKKSLTVDRIVQDLYYLKRESKLDLLIRLLDFYDFSSVMVFINTKSKVDDVVSSLKKLNYKAEALHGDLKQTSRDKVMNNFKAGYTKVLVCTDVAARGIDVENLEAIVNFDLPQENELYVHRIGRTGRAGNDGHSITFASYSEKRKVSFIEHYTKSFMNEKTVPTASEIYEKMNYRFLSQIKDKVDSAISAQNKKLIDQIKDLDIDTDKLLNYFINNSAVKTKHYNDIHLRDSRDSRNRSNNRRDKYNNRSNNRRDRDNSKDRNFKSRERDYKMVSINLGRFDRVRPQELVNLANTVGVRKSNVGDIYINKNSTDVNVTKGALPFFLKLDGKKLNGKVIKISKNN